ncbi:MAG TPA: IS1595 family transposase [Mycobacteriales bacterium]|jgi:transposase-like protein|nr:IS1595 family transposase [Mycobacteriales bacterium]
MSKQDFSIPALMNRLSSEAEAYKLLEELRWGADKSRCACPHCGVIGGHYYLAPANGSSRKTRMTGKTGAVSQRRVWKCCACRKQFSVLTGTIFHGSKISVRTWVLVILEMCASKNGVSAREIERKYDLTAKTAWFMCHRIREAMKLEPMAGLLSGVVAADETWIGGKPSNQSKSKRAPRARWEVKRTEKPSVLALVDTVTGEVRSRVVPNVKGATLRDAISQQVEMGATTLVTDEAQAYKMFAGEMKGHERVTHSADEYVNKDGFTTNQAEAYFGQLKRSIDGTHHHVSVEHLARYLANHDFLRSTHEMDDSDRMRLLVARTTGRRLTYKPLTDHRDYDTPSCP